MPIPQLIVIAIAGYGGIGLVFAVTFVTVGIDRVDHAARNAPLSFRLLMIPGSLLLWPIVARKWMAARSEGANG